MSDNNNVTPPTQVHFKIGPENSVSDLAKEEGAIIFSSTGTGENDRAYIYIDTSSNKRIKISSQHAEQATNDDSGLQIDTSYIKYGSVVVDAASHKMTYTNGVGGTGNSSEVGLPFVCRGGDVMSGNLTITGAVSASAGFSGNLTGNVTGNITGNVSGNIVGDSGTLKILTIKNETTSSNAYNSTNPRIDFVSDNEGETSETLSLIYTNVNTIDNKDLSPGSLTLVGSSGASNPYFIAPRIIVGSNFNGNYVLNADSALIHSWINTEGTGTGWKNTTHDGGIYMTDNTWVKVYNTKSFLVPGTSTILRAEGTLQVGNGVADSNNVIANPIKMEVSSSGIMLGSTIPGANGDHLTTINGRLIINPSKNTSNEIFNEGIRINQAYGESAFSGITMGGVDGSTQNTGQGIWFIGTQKGTRNLYIAHNGRDGQGGLYIIGRKSGTGSEDGVDMGFKIKPRLTITGNNSVDVNTSYALYVDGGGYFKNSVYFEKGLLLRGDDTSSVPVDAGIKLLPSMSAQTISSSSFGQDQIQFYKDTDSGSSKSRTGRQNKMSAILSISGINNTNLTHQLSFDISNKTDIDGNLYHRVGNSAGWESWRILLDNTNVSWSDWTAGNIAGPKANISLGGTNIESAAIPSATGTASGIVTTDTQTFGGNKTFTGNVIAKNGAITLNDNITLGTGNLDANSRSITISNGGGNIVITSNLTTVNDQVIKTRKISFGNVDAIVAAGNGATTFTGTLSGNASTASALANAVNINGTSFNGSSEITTAKWGTKRSITISDGTNSSTTANIDGSGDITLTLPSTIVASLSGTADRAIKDASGNTITTYYASASDLSTLSSTVNGLLAENDAMIFKGTIDYTDTSHANSTVSELPNNHNAGWTYKVVKAGSYVGQQCEVGDLIICIKDRENASGQNNLDWTIAQTNLDGTVTGSAVAVADGAMAVFNGEGGNRLKAATSVGDGSHPIYINSSGKAVQIDTVAAATSATTATNLANNPSLLIGTAGTNNAGKIAVSAGGKTSGYIEVPYATTSGSATNLASAPSFTAGTGSNAGKITVTAGGQTSAFFTVPYATSAGSATSATNDGNGSAIASTYLKITGTYYGNRIYYPNSSSTTNLLSASGHYISSNKIAINSTSAPSYNFYVNGTSYFNGQLNATELILPTSASNTVGGIWIG